MRETMLVLNLMRVKVIRNDMLILDMAMLHVLELGVSVHTLVLGKF